MGKGQYVRLGFSGSLERAQVDFSFTEPHFLDRNMAAGFRSLLQGCRSDQRGFVPRARRGRRSSGSASPSPRIRSSVSATSSNRRRSLASSSNASLAVKQAAGTVDVSSVGYTIAYDTRNLPASPTSGVFASFLPGPRRCRRRRGLLPVRRRCARLLSHYQQDHLGRPCPGRCHRGLGRPGRPLDRPVLQRRRDDQRLQTAPATVRATPARTRSPTTGSRTAAEIPSAARSIGPRPPRSAFPSPTTRQPRHARRRVRGCRLAIRPKRSGHERGEAGRKLYSRRPRHPPVDGFQHHLAIPLGPLRADIADALLKAQFDKTQIFRFGASTNF